MARVLSSPLQRARDTAAAIAAAHGLAVEIDERLIELDYGDWDGLPLTDVPADDWAAWRRDPEFAPPGGERLADVTARVAAFCADVLDRAISSSRSVTSRRSRPRCACALGSTSDHVADAARRRVGDTHRPPSRRSAVPRRLQRRVDRQRDRRLTRCGADDADRHRPRGLPADLLRRAARQDDVRLAAARVARPAARGLVRRGAAFVVHVVIAVSIGVGPLPHPPGPRRRRCWSRCCSRSVRCSRSSRPRKRKRTRPRRSSKASRCASHRVVGTAFVVIFIAEWGDLTQVLTANLAARYHAPLSVAVGRRARAVVGRGDRDVQRQRSSSASSPDACCAASPASRARSSPSSRWSPPSAADASTFGGRGYSVVRKPPRRREKRPARWANR